MNTARLALSLVHFITFGDWGAGTIGQRSVATAIEHYCARTPCGFVLTLGDNFYENGVRSVTDPKWKLFYKNVYGRLDLPFYAVIGNHDERGSIAAQIDYGKTDSSWKMPGPYYSIRLPEGSAKPAVEIFVINNGDRKFQPNEKEWLEKALARSRAPWKILALHIPIITNGKHGDDDAGINDELVPVICGKVDLVLSGHDHNFSHLKGPWKNCTIEQLIVGTGGMRLRTADAKDPRVIATGSFFGFGWFSATASQLDFRMIAADGSEFYKTSWEK